MGNSYLFCIIGSRRAKDQKISSWLADPKTLAIEECSSPYPRDQPTNSGGPRGRLTERVARFSASGQPRGGLNSPSNGLAEGFPSCASISTPWIPKLIAPSRQAPRLPPCLLSSISGRLFQFLNQIVLHLPMLYLRYTRVDEFARHAHATEFFLKLHAEVGRMRGIFLVFSQCGRIAVVVCQGAAVTTSKGMAGNVAKATVRWFAAVFPFFGVRLASPRR